ncbi:unnamed protein product [Ceratitis capitata]|uniref:(Mediterranean fruit fly) hypothetical protein n=1 Tax=Ceratitis capitata TaxID=7213 RepID=A0A811UCE8_CERCA|nr:unnamed protein product [Ceratitis capitata]
MSVHVSVQMYICMHRPSIVHPPRDCPFQCRFIYVHSRLFVRQRDCLAANARAYTKPTSKNRLPLGSHQLRSRVRTLLNLKQSTHLVHPTFLCFASLLRI